MILAVTLVSDYCVFYKNGEAIGFADTFTIYYRNPTISNVSISFLRYSMY